MQGLSRPFLKIAFLQRQPPTISTAESSSSILGMTASAYAWMLEAQKSERAYGKCYVPLLLAEKGQPRALVLDLLRKEWGRDCPEQRKLRQPLGLPAFSRSAQKLEE
jgi:hypothetical protein